MLRAAAACCPAFIDDSAQFIGDVEIGEECGVWMDVVIRGDMNSIRVGNRSNSLN